MDIITVSYICLLNSSSVLPVASSANNHKECKEINSAIAEGKYKHTDANVIRNIDIRSLILENEGGISREGTLQGRSDVVMTRSYDVKGLDERDDYFVIR
jgi:hypothetical protein